MFMVVFDLFQSKVDESEFVLGKTNWRGFYGDIKEEPPPGILNPLVNSAHTTCFVHNNNYGNVVTWSLHTCVFIYVKNAPVILFSKKQKNFESSMFSSEFLAMRITRYISVLLRYKLRIFGVLLDRTSDVMYDNQGVVNNTSLSKYTLGNKQNILNYHVVRKESESGILWV